MKNNAATARLLNIMEVSDQQIDKLLARYDKDLIRAYKTSLDEIRQKLAAMYEKFGDKAKYSEMASYNRLKNLQKELSQQLRDLNQNSIEIIKTEIKTIYRDSYMWSAYSYESAVGVNLGFTLLSSKSVEAAVINPYDKIRWPNRQNEHTQKLNQQIREEVTQGLIQGKGYPEVARAIKKRTEVAASKALKIARTESHRAQSAGKLVAYDTAVQAAKDLGMKINKKWVATLDGRTRDTHRSMDGQTADENGMFTLPGGRKTEGPGLSGIAEEDINCRCTVRSEIAGIKATKRKDNTSKEVIPYQSFSEWEKKRF